MNDIETLWPAIFGSAFETWPWWRTATFLEGKWDTPGLVFLEIDDPDGEEGVDSLGVSLSKDTFMEQLQAIEHQLPKYIKEELYAEYPDFDAVSGDYILQALTLGSAVYG